MKKRILSILLCLCMALPLFPLGVAATSGTDASVLSEAEVKAVWAGFGFGTNEDWNGVATREELAQALAYLRLGKAGAEALTYPSSSFEDVTTERATAPFIEYCKTNNLMSYTEAIFGPTTSVSGFDAMKGLLLALGYTPAANFSGSGGDNRVSIEWFSHTHTQASDCFLPAVSGEVTSYASSITRLQLACAVMQAGMSPLYGESVTGSAFEAVSLRMEDDNSARRFWYMDTGGNGVFDKDDDTVLSDYTYPILVLSGGNAIVAEGYIERPVLTVSVASSDGDSLTGLTYAWYGGEVNENQILDKEHPLPVLANTADYTAPADLTVGTAKYTAYVTADGFTPALRVFTVAVSSAAEIVVGEVTDPAVAGGAYTAPVTIGSGSSPVDVEVVVDTTDTDSPSAELTWPMDRGTSVEVNVSAVDGDRAALSATFRLPGNSTYTPDDPYAVDDIDIATLLAAIDGSVDVADAVLNAANDTMGQSYIAEATAPVLVFEAPAGTSTAAVTLGNRLITGLAARDGELNVSAGAGSAVLGGSALTEAAANGNIVLGVAPSANEESDFTGIPGTLCTGTGLDVTFTGNNGTDIELTEGTLNIYMAMPQDADLSAMAAVHVAGSSRLEVDTYAASAARDALNLNPAYSLIASIDGWRLETPLHAYDSGWRYYLDDEMVKDNIVIGNYFFEIKEDGSVKWGFYNRPTDGLPKRTESNASFYPPELGMMVRSCSPVGLMTLEWSPLADTSWYEGHASDNSFTINTAEELAGLAKLVNGEAVDGSGNIIQRVDFEGKTITIGSNIDLSGANWTPIGKQDGYVFKGTFGGGGKTISNMTIASAPATYAALFGECKDACIKNLTVDGRVTAVVEYAAGIVAYAKETHIENCRNAVEVDITGGGSNYRAGGIAAYMEGASLKTIVGCSNTGDIKVTNAGNAHVGGIVGYLSKDRVYNSYNTGDISVTGSVSPRTGGIAGTIYQASGGTAYIANCYSLGTVTSRQIGGVLNAVYSGHRLVGYLQSGSVVNSYGYSSVSNTGGYYGQNSTETTKTAEALKASVNTLNTWVSSPAITLGSTEIGFATWYNGGQYNDGFPCFTPSYHLTVQDSYTDGTPGHPDGTGDYREGKTVSINAGARTGYSFGGWTVVSGGVTLNNPSNATTFFTMPGSAVTVKANWNQKGGGGHAPTSTEEKTNPDKDFVNPFTDVSEGDWSYEYVRFVYENALMKGTATDKFSPQLGTTRGMIVTILWRMDSMPTSDESMLFEDVSNGKYYYDAICWAAEHDIVLGYDAVTFGPDNQITREQLAAIFHRYAAFKGYDTDARDNLSAFTDRPSGWAQENVQWAVAEELIQGKGSGILDPKGKAERCQLAAILYRFSNTLMK